MTNQPMTNQRLAEPQYVPDTLATRTHQTKKRRTVNDAPFINSVENLLEIILSKVQQQAERLHRDPCPLLQGCGLLFLPLHRGQV